MKKNWLRWLPALAVTSLLAIALLAPTLGLTARTTPEITHPYYPICTVVQNGDHVQPLVLSPGQGVVQPIAEFIGNVATCTLDVSPNGSVGGKYELLAWDPSTLAPDPTTITLRTTEYAPTTRSHTWRWDPFPALITRSLPQVADRPIATTALRFKVTSYNQGYSINAAYDPDGSFYFPQAYLTQGAGTPIPFQGSNPLVAHAICGGDEYLQSHQIVQCVSTANAQLGSSPVEYVQKFRVPVASEIRWVELGFGQVAPYGPVEYGRIQIADAEGQATPPVNFGAPIFDANFLTFVPVASPGFWSATWDASTYGVLQPHHDYWLVVTTNKDYTLFARTLNGGESPYFKTAIGKLFSRAIYNGATQEVADRALSFKLIGIPQGTVDVGEPAPSRGSFRLAVAPNPARGAARFEWSGATGAVRFEVIDARGRRVASGNGAEAAGRWTWNGAGSEGQALPAGMYFVRARDVEGRVASARLSLVR